MSNTNLPRIPLYLQNSDIAKAASKGRDSYETFRPNEIHDVTYRQMGDDRPSTHMHSVLRRNPDGTLDLEWATDMVLDALRALRAFRDRGVSDDYLATYHKAILTAVFPARFRTMMPGQAEVMTKLSLSEKEKLRDLVEAQLKEEENWNGGRGGDSVEGRTDDRAV